MPRAIRFNEYGDIDVLRVVEVEAPMPGHAQAVVKVKAAGINPGEASIRKGLMHERFPATFPSGQGSDLAGVVVEVGEMVDDVVVGDEVIGFTNQRASHAELVVVPTENLTPRPPTVPWEVAGALFVAGTTAWATVRAVAPAEGETVVVSGAAGGVGSLASQLAVMRGATVIGLASEPHHEWLHSHGVVPLTYDRDVAGRVLTMSGGQVDAFIDTFGQGYVAMAIKELGVPIDRINTIIDWQAAADYGVKSDGNATAASADVLAELADLIAARKLEVRVAATYPLDRVGDAYRELEKRHTLGKIVLVP